jgi:hypothetical protein
MSTQVDEDAKMKFREYLAGAIAFAKDNPEVLEMDCGSWVEGDQYYDTVESLPSIEKTNSDGEYAKMDEHGYPIVAL